MDPQRFDAIARALAAGVSRRWFARAMAGLGTGVLFRGLSGRRRAAASGMTDPSTGPRRPDDDPPPDDPPPGRPCSRHEDCDPGPEFQCQEGVCLLDEGVCADFVHDFLCVNETICCKNAGRVECHCGDECGVHCTEHERCAKSLINDRWFCRCEAGYVRCGGTCVEGTCCTNDQCSLPNTACVDSNCICAEGFTDCGGACIDLQADENHCGACGRACAPDRTCCTGACVDSAPLVPATGYTPDDDPDLMNPERGMYFEAYPGETADPRRQSHTTVPGFLHLGEVCNQDLIWDRDNPDLSSPVLKDFAVETLEAARARGVKVLFRPRYDRIVQDAEGDTCNVPSTCLFNDVGEPVFHANSLDRQKNHINAVAAMLAEYKDVIAFIQAGYLGNWGEWNTGNSSRCTPYTEANAPMLYCCTDRLEIIDHLVSTYAAAGIAQHVELRTPVFAKEALELNASATVGLHNDCFMSSRDTDVVPVNGSDSGTYSDFLGCSPQPCDSTQICGSAPNNCGSTENFGSTVDARAWAMDRTENYSFGGETCPRNPTGSERWRTCSNMIGPDSEPASLHMSYLNGDYVKAAVDTWELGDADGNTCYEDIRRKLGYRFDVTSVEYASTVAAGQSFQVRVQVANTGWAKLHKPRQAKIVLRSGSLSYPFEIPEVSGGAVASWAPGQTTLISVTACPPPPGTYKVRLWIPDPDVVDPDAPWRIPYAVKLATKHNGGNVFDPATGENDLGVEIEVQ